MEPEAFRLLIDVTEVAHLGTAARTAVTVVLPDPATLPERPIVCFAFPGGGYSRGYFTFDMPDGSGGGQAGFHATRGWIFVACDSLGFGEATATVGSELTLDVVARGNAATVTAVMDMLASGSVSPGYPAIGNAVRLGIGQSMGGCFTIVQQAQHRTFDGIAPLGSSAIHTVVPSKPGTPAIPWPWLLRSSGLDQPLILNGRSPDSGDGTDAEQATLLEMMNSGENPLQWAFHWDDEPADIVGLDMKPGQGTDAVPPWRSAGLPPACGAQMVAPGVVATEAASITVPVLIGAGERDVIPNPWAEPAAFRSSTDVGVYVCPRMAHMHNFAHTRELFWQRIHSWGEGVAAQHARRGNGAGGTSGSV